MMINTVVIRNGRDYTNATVLFIGEWRELHFTAFADHKGVLTSQGPQEGAPVSLKRMEKALERSRKTADEGCASACQFFQNNLLRLKLPLSTSC